MSDRHARGAARPGAVGSTLAGGFGTLPVAGLWMAVFPGRRRRQRLHLQVPDAGGPTADILLVSGAIA
ncbi:MAG: hypothetical protein KGJ32_07345 [Xanthomonadaceae bacterium]|nr:hypothetical protein [Xanthomonadaceae bacterium]